MQNLEFVNVSGPEPWKNKEAKKFVRSHAMKDFRRRQRERNPKGKVKKNSQSGEGSVPTANKKVKPKAGPELPPEASMENALLPVRPTSMELTQVHPAAQGRGWNSGSSSPSYTIHDQMPFGRRIPSPISLIPKISSPISFNPRMYSGLPSPSPSDSSDLSTSRSLKRMSDTPDYQSQADFDLGVSTAAFAVLDDVHAQFDRMTSKFFHSVHSYLAFIHRPRFEKRVADSKIKADAEMSVLLLSMKLVAEPINYAQSGADPRQNSVYIAAKHFHRLVNKSKGPSLDLIQSGILLCLYEHNAAIGDVAYKTLADCANMGQRIGLNASNFKMDFGVPDMAAYQEEFRRTYWALISMDCIVTLHDEKRERAMLMPIPTLDDILPSVKEDYWTDASLNDEYLSLAYYQPVSSQLPQWAHSFARQAQSARLMCMVQDLLRYRFEDDPAGMRTKILKVDQLLQENMVKSLFDCNGNCTQHCGPISMAISASYLLHEFQLLATMTSSDPEDLEALARSKLAIVKLIQMMVDILGMFPITHLPELSPSALYCPYMAAKLSLQLDRVNGVKAPPTLAPANFQLMLQSLRQFSTLWRCTDYYVKDIVRAQSRALPMPMSVA
ncbi:putative fungal-specific transcription factor [Venturia nashicola]|uniref:Putative fungal-specific transcription factor n=1 Tax=Venturia nashicola TaxID=86259 RepID=A0A4Z1NW56_9PEZI|nr:putative fungal-specific transcription factor [Venturia nashicola]